MVGTQRITFHLLQMQLVVCCSLYYEHQGPRLKNINRSRETGLMSSILQIPNEKVHLSSTSYILIFPPIFYTSAEKT